MVKGAAPLLEQSALSRFRDSAEQLPGSMKDLRCTGTDELDQQPAVSALERCVTESSPVEKASRHRAVHSSEPG